MILLGVVASIAGCAKADQLTSPIGFRLDADLIPDRIQLPYAFDMDRALSVSRNEWPRPITSTLLRPDRAQPHPRSAAVLVIDQARGQPLYAKNGDIMMPIASITKLMTALVVLDSALPLDEKIRILPADVDRLKGTRSRLKIGLALTREELLKLALMSSENRAASALARHYPGGTKAFIRAMNRKARTLGMYRTIFLDSTGLNPGNVSTAYDLALLVDEAYRYPHIRAFTTSDSHRVAYSHRRYRRVLGFRNSNKLIRNNKWHIGLSKTGYISEAGRCLVMQATIATRPVIIVLLDALDKTARIADANEIKHWIETSAETPVVIAGNFNTGVDER